MSLNIHVDEYLILNPLSANPTNWSNTLKQFVDNLPTNCLSVLDHFVKLALKGLTSEVKFGDDSRRLFVSSKTFGFRSKNIFERKLEVGQQFNKNYYNI